MHEQCLYYSMSMPLLRAKSGLGGGGVHVAFNAKVINDIERKFGWIVERVVRVGMLLNSAFNTDRG